MGKFIGFIGSSEEGRHVYIDGLSRLQAAIPGRVQVLYPDKHGLIATYNLLSLLSLPQQVQVFIGGEGVVAPLDSPIGLYLDGVIQGLDTLVLEYELQQINDQQEILRQIIEREYQRTHSLLATLLVMMQKLQGAFSLVLFFKDLPGSLFALNSKSVLCIGKAERGCLIVKDPRLLPTGIQQVLAVPDRSIVSISEQGIEVIDNYGHRQPADFLPYVTTLPQALLSDSSKQQSLLLNEILEQKTAVKSTLEFLGSLGTKMADLSQLTDQQIRGLRHIVLFGSGSSLNAARIAQFYFESMVQIPVTVRAASEITTPHLNAAQTLYIAVSQTGETAEVLQALGLLRESGAQTLVVTNSAASTAVRLAQGFVLTQAGTSAYHSPALASFSCQLVMLALLAGIFALKSGKLSHDDYKKLVEELQVSGELIEFLAQRLQYELVYTVAPALAQAPSLVVAGRHILYPFAFEAALKFRELAQRFAHCFAAGELQHAAALKTINKQVPVILLSHPDEELYEKTLEDAYALKKATGTLIVFGFEGQSELKKVADIWLELPRINTFTLPIAISGIIQLLAYHTGREVRQALSMPVIQVEPALITYS